MFVTPGLSEHFDRRPLETELLCDIYRGTYYGHARLDRKSNTGLLQRQVWREIKISGS